MYSGGGYVFQLAGRQSEITSKLTRLKTQDWMDELTRAVFVEFSVYNAQVSSFKVFRNS